MDSRELTGAIRPRLCENADYFANLEPSSSE